MNQADKDKTGMVTFISPYARRAWNSVMYPRLAFTSRHASCFSLSSARVTQSAFSKPGGEAGFGTIVDLGLTSSLVEIAEHEIRISITRY